MRATAIVGFGLCLGLGCTKPADAPANAGVPSTTGATTPATDPSSPAKGPPRFWVASGVLHAYDLDGKQLASLGDRGDEARHVEGDGRIVTLDTPEAGPRLTVFGADGEPVVEALIPTDFDPDTCTTSTPRPGGEVEGDRLRLGLQEDVDFVLASSGTHACLTLRDRNANMNDFVVEYAVDLATGKVASVVDFATDDMCPTDSLPACADTTRNDARPWTEDAPAYVPAKAWAHSYDETTGVLSHAGQPVRELCEPKDRRGDDWKPSYGCVSVEQKSTSGRWLLVTAFNDVGGDYIYRVVYLLDLETGGLSSMACEDDGACRLVSVNPDKLYVGDEPEGYTIVGETEVDTLPDDRFWVDGKLLIPSAGKAVAIGGSLVLTAG